MIEINKNDIRYLNELFYNVKEHGGYITNNISKNDTIITIHREIKKILENV